MSRQQNLRSIEDRQPENHVIYDEDTGEVIIQFQVPKDRVEAAIADIEASPHLKKPDGSSRTVRSLKIDRQMRPDELRVYEVRNDNGEPRMRPRQGQGQPPGLGNS